jgi:hypothetical protein
MIGISSITDSRAVYQPKQGTGNQRNKRTRPVAFENIWRKCSTDEAWYQFSDGTIYYYAPPATDEAYQVALALKHGTFFDFFVRRDGFAGTSYARVDSVPDDAELIYSYPPYAVGTIAPCGGYCMIHYPSQPLGLAGATWSNTSFNPIVEYFTVTDNFHLEMGWPVTDVYSSGMQASGVTNNYCENEDTHLKIDWTIDLSNGFNANGTNVAIFVNDTQVVNYTPPGGMSTAPFSYSDSATVPIAKGSYQLACQLTNNGFGAPSVNPSSLTVAFSYV